MKKVLLPQGQFNSILYSDCQIHFSASTKHVIKGHQTITNYTLNLGGLIVQTGRPECEHHRKNWCSAYTVIHTSIPDIGRAYQPSV